jgi:hypothetical protein
LRFAHTADGTDERRTHGALRRPRLLTGGIGALVLGCLFLLASAVSAFAANEHTTLLGSYEKTGPGSGTGEGGQVAWDPTNDFLYLCADERYYRLHRPGPGAADPAGTVTRPGPFGNCADFEVDDSATASAGNVLSITGGFFTPALIHGYNSAGSPLGSPFPFELGGGQGCDVAIASNGNFFLTHRAGQSIKQFSSTGNAITTIPFAGGTPCSMDVVPATGDLIVQCNDCTNRPIYRLTAASGYTAKTLVIPSVPGFGEVEMAINGAQNKIYLANLGEQNARSYDLTTGALLETITPVGQGFPQDVAVDEETDTIVLTVGGYESGRIQEYPGVKLPVATTGNPVGDNELTGTADPKLAGPITGCFFEYGPVSASGFPSKVNCADTLPIAVAEPVSALLPTSLLGGETYRYRLGVSTAAPGVGHHDGEKTVKPEWVDALAPVTPSPIARTTASLKGSFTGNGEATEYKFEWGLASSSTFESESSFASAGSPVGAAQISHPATGLQPEAEYKFRVWAKNGIGLSRSATMTFKTLPKVQNLTTKDATDIAPKSATLNGSFDGDGTATSYQFEYGQIPGVYSSTTPETSAGSPNVTTQVSAPLSGLELEKTYYFRVVATNTMGTTYGAEKSFTTKPAVAGVQTLAATDVDAEDITLNGTFTGDGAATSYYFEYGLTQSYGLTTPEVDAGSPSGATPVTFELTEYEGFKTYNYRLVAKNSFGETRGANQTFTAPAAELPGVGPASAGEVSPTTAKLSSSVDPNRWATVYTFEYGPTADYGSATVLDVVVDGKGTSLVPVDAELTDLAPGTTYHFRIVAINLVGTTHGADQTFITPDVPLIVSADSSNVSTTGAQLSGLVDPKQSPTTAHFEYGANGAFDQTTPSVNLGADSAPHPLSADLTGLAPGTTYSFRLVATNAIGTSTSVPGTFTTSPAPASTPPPDGGGGDKPLRCKKGFVKRTGKNGKPRCVKRKKRNRR